MKKLFYVLALGALAACGGSGESKEEPKTDTAAAVTPAPAPDSSAAMPADTTHKADSSAAKK